jgi:hypothetical protein
MMHEGYVTYLPHMKRLIGPEPMRDDYNEMGSHKETELLTFTNLLHNAV